MNVKSDRTYKVVETTPTGSQATPPRATDSFVEQHPIFDLSLFPMCPLRSRLGEWHGSEAEILSRGARLRRRIICEAFQDGALRCWMRTYVEDGREAGTVLTM